MDADDTNVSPPEGGKTGSDHNEFNPFYNNNLYQLLLLLLFLFDVFLLFIITTLISLLTMGYATRSARNHQEA